MCPFWFEPDFDPEVKLLIMCNRGVGCGGTYCHEDSRNWALFLLAQGVRKVELHSGTYDASAMDSEEEPDTQGHSWVVVNGCIFDPTATQFDCDAFADRYESFEEYAGSEITHSRIT